MANYSFQKNYGGSVFTFFVPKLRDEGSDEESEDVEDEDES
jgi:hypothetical protein